MAKKMLYLTLIRLRRSLKHWIDQYILVNMTLAEHQPKRTKLDLYMRTLIYPFRCKEKENKSIVLFFL